MHRPDHRLPPVQRPGGQPLPEPALLIARPTILLFDVDATLVDTGGAGRRALERAFVEAVGDARCLDFSFAGMTDRAIVRRGLGGAASDAAMDALIERYLALLGDELAVGEGYRVLPGVQALLEGLAALAAGAAPLAIGLGTGNVWRGAELKLAPADLMRYFSFGGFGCDAEDRAELLAVGAARGAVRLGRRRSDCDTIVVGDTPRDVAAALAIGARCTAVASGGHSVAELRQAGATQAVASLEEIRAAELIAPQGAFGAPNTR